MRLPFSSRQRSSRRAHCFFNIVARQSSPSRRFPRSPIATRSPLLIVAFYTSTSAATVATIVIVAIAIVAFIIIVALRDRRGGRSCSFLPRLPLWHRVRAPSLEASAQKNQLIVVLRSPHIACLLVRVPRYYDWGAHDRRDHVVSIVAMRSIRHRCDRLVAIDLRIFSRCFFSSRNEGGNRDDSIAVALV